MNTGLSLKILFLWIRKCEKVQNHRERTFAAININNIQNNVDFIKKTVDKACKILGVVKADAYGHGAVKTAKVLQEKGIDYFGVSNINEACQLKNGGIRGDILILGYTPPDSYNNIIKNNFTVTVFDIKTAHELAAFASEQNQSIRIHIKVDTGMSRLGFSATDDKAIDQTANEIKKIYSFKGLVTEGIFTHFAESDNIESDFTQSQFNKFSKLLYILETDDVKFKYRHCCNSAAIINYPHMQLDMVRPGIILYGLMPSDSMTCTELMPAMELKSVISQIKELDIGATVSYGRTAVINKKVTAAVIPIGYADGYPRCLSNDFYVLVNGKKTPILGRICMDMSMIDITDIPNCSKGLEITVFGHDGDEFLPIDDIAKKNNTINYEIACIIGKRVPRIYIKNGIEVDYCNYIL